MKNIEIKNARLHNLQHINIAVPKDKLIAVTGVSGSGKSSLAFDIIFEEGRKQYLQSLGALAEIEDEKKFDSISGIGPAIAVQQNIIRQNNPRATVGTRTGALNMLALLFAREGSVSCSSCADTEERLPASYFSCNNPDGMCFTCSGKGAYYKLNMEKIVPDESTTLEQVGSSIGITAGLMNVLRRNFSEYMDLPFQKLPDEVKEDVIYGHYANGNFQKRSFCLTRYFEGKVHRGEDTAGIYDIVKCESCHGYRVGEEARNVLLNGRHIGELGLMSISELDSFLKDLPGRDSLSAFSSNLLGEILKKTESLIKVRLGHLSLYRELPGLSGGELQRLFLNSHLDSGMDSIIYVLDEPTSGLHESEKEELIKSIRNLREIGNTVIVVEHDRKTIESAEHIIDIGPKAGVEGGRVVYQGDLAGLLECRDSLTGLYFSGKAAMPARQRKIISENNPSLTIRDAETNNLRDITVTIPLGALVGVAGVSGSGKSSLISKTLVPLLKRHFHYTPEKTEEDDEQELLLINTVADRLEGMEHISGYAEVSQSPIGRNLNSNPVTYIGVWDKIRNLFAAQPGAVDRGLSAGHFSFNSKGACSACGGSGREKLWMGGNFFIYTVCKECGGKRYSDEALSVTYKDRNIYDVLEMSVSGAVSFFEEEPAILPTLRVLEEIGMGYIKLGQPTPTLSGGEAQRIKLAKEIGRRRKGHTLYILDEPTTGLSLYDTARLIELLDELVRKGNSVIVIEHDSDLLSICDWIVELGPGGGDKGGRLIAEGALETLKGDPGSLIGRYLE